MMSHLRPAAAALAVLVLSASASAQDAGRARTTLDPDTRVRVTVVTSLHPVTGVVVAHHVDTLVLRRDTDDSTITVLLAQVVRLDVSHGERTSMGRGAAVGFGWGALAGTVVGAVTYRKPDCAGTSFCLDFGPGLDMIMGAAVGGLSGLGVGALIGSRAIEIWEPAATVLGGPTRLGVASSSRSIALTVSRAF